jgi:hypothetical protein
VSGGEAMQIFGRLLLIPAILFLMFYFIMGRRAIVAGLITIVVSAAGGAFLASAAYAMATSVDPNAAMLRGAAFGAAGGVVVAGVLAFVLKLMRL